MSRLRKLKSMRQAAKPLRPLAMSVAIATFGVGLLYTFLVPRLTALAADAGSTPPELAQWAMSAGSWWLVGSVVLGAGAAWLARDSASVNQRLAARAALQLILLLDAVLVGVSLIGIYSVIVALPQGYG